MKFLKFTYCTVCGVLRKEGASKHCPVCMNAGYLTKKQKTILVATIE